MQCGRVDTPCPSPAGCSGCAVTEGEYSTGMIRSTLAAVPRRLPVLWSTAALYGLVALLVGTLGAFVSFLVGSQIVSGAAAARHRDEP